ncbi:hypothetical protein [Variovorax boronicumulans]|uniref:hypothetical protein n=1 Tax=Variovorax boronicumulans TaxID=436515 RepID=UPI003472DB2A
MELVSSYPSRGDRQPLTALRRWAHAFGKQFARLVAPLPGLGERHGGVDAERQGLGPKLHAAAIGVALADRSALVLYFLPTLKT